MESISVGDREIQWHTTRWLGVWLDSQLILKEHHNVRLKKARGACIGCGG